MDARLLSEKVLAELQYDYRDFSIDHFIHWLEQKKGRRIFSTPYDFPAGMFGTWFTDDEEPNEYIFYRNNVPPIYQIHNQLHELANFLLGHPTIHIIASFWQRYYAERENYLSMNMLSCAQLVKELTRGLFESLRRKL